MSKKKILFLSIFLFSLQLIFTTSVRIPQIDTSKLLLNQDINLYISITDSKGIPIKNLSKDKFSIYESPDGKNFEKINKILNFQTEANYQKGINFLLLIDNSGSMYNDMNGKSTKNKNRMRITYAKKAVASFLQSITSNQDKVGLVSYNSFYTSYTKPTANKEKIYEYLENINKPIGDEGWSEVYSSLYLAIDEFSTVKGRKVVIILSDGENMPYYKYTKKEHKTFGNKIFNYKEPITESQKEGISIFAINFGMPGEKKDINLKKIAKHTGGAVFNAYNQKELSSVYYKITDQILHEYLITYRATMDPTDKKFVKVNFCNNKKKYIATRCYFSSTLFGTPLKKFNPLILIAFLIACILLWLLSLMKFKRKTGPPSLEVLSTPVGKAVTKTLTLNKGRTIIGGSKQADMTFIGAPKMKEKHATIQFDKNKNAYTIIADGNLTVNNKPVKTKILESGDVINTGEATIVFDEGLMKKGKK